MNIDNGSRIEHPIWQKWVIDNIMIGGRATLFLTCGLILRFRHYISTLDLGATFFVVLVFLTILIVSCIVSPIYCVLRM